MISGFIVIRNTVWPHFAFPILVSKYLSSDDSSSESPQKNALNLVIVIFLFVSMILFFPQVKPTVAHILPETKKYVFSRYSPKKISDYLNENTSSEAIFNQWELGSFLIYAQKRKIFIDTRNIIYKRENFNQYSSIINGGDYDKVFTKFKIGFIVFDKDRYKKFYEKLLKDNVYREVLNERGIVLFEINKRA
jgi:hypothetical protein